MSAGAYRRAGVDLEAAAEATTLIAELARATSGPEVIEGVGGFAGLYRLDENRLLAASTDGVGTKLEIARLARRLDTVGIDLVAMCANDVVCTGARPLFFLDYIAVGRLVPEEVSGIVAGVAEGCRRAACALLGGETAEHPGVLAPGKFDLAGFCVGLVEETQLLGPKRVREGDAVIGLRSSGLHSNGFSLVRQAVDGLDMLATPEGLERPLAEELLEPTLIYVPAILDASGRGILHAAAHITGGGMVENLPRVLPPGLGATVELRAWTPPPVFSFVERASGAARDEMLRTFNMGIGMTMVVASDAEDQAVELSATHGFEAVRIGTIERGEGARFV
jgi:phosphoribosylformylglycinamidine cyclo-ligase